MPCPNKSPLQVTATTDVLNQASSSDFKVGVRAQADSLDLLIHGVIGDPWTATDSTSIANILREHKGKPVNVDINSPGGLAYDGVSIYNALSQHDGPITVNITGLAASAATIIAMAGDKIRIAENATFMIHRAMGMAVGNQKVMLGVAEFLDKTDSQIAATYAARTGRKAETMLKLMDGSMDGTSFSGPEAIANGFADELIPLKKKSKDATTNTIDATPTAETVTTATASASELTGQFAAEARQRLADAVAVTLTKLKLDETT